MRSAQYQEGFGDGYQEALYDVMMALGIDDYGNMLAWVDNNSTSDYVKEAARKARDHWRQS